MKHIPLFSTLSIAATLLFATHAMGHPHRCTPTPQISGQPYPGAGKFIPSNNLLRPAGKIRFASGPALRISGQVVDSDCVPVAGAQVQLWQYNTKGRFRVPSKAALATPEATFAGTGIAVTDRQGYFNFDTLYPGKSYYYHTLNRGEEDEHSVRRLIAPRVNFRISHPDHKRFTGSFYFEEDGYNKEDIRYRNFRSSTKESVTFAMTPARDGSKQPPSTAEARLRITLHSSDPWRSY